MVVAVAEFGRPLHEPGDKGNDPGHGSVSWVLGGKVNGGRMLGRQAPVTQAGLNQNRDYPVLTEYRALFGGLFQRLYGLDGARLNAVFPDAAPVDLRLV